jgi:hypothetical protein
MHACMYTCTHANPYLEHMLYSNHDAALLLHPHQICINAYTHKHTQTKAHATNNNAHSLVFIRRIHARDAHVLRCIRDRAVTWEVLQSVTDEEPVQLLWAFHRFDVPDEGLIHTLRTVLEARLVTLCVSVWRVSRVCECILLPFGQALGLTFLHCCVNFVWNLIQVCDLVWVSGLV